MSGQADAPGGGTARPDDADRAVGGALTEAAVAAPGAGDGASKDEPGAPTDSAALMSDDAPAGDAAAGPDDAEQDRTGATGDGGAAVPTADAAPTPDAEDAPQPGEAAEAPAAEQAAAGVASPATEGADAVDPALLAEGARIAEALIFASDRPVTPAMLGAVLPPGLAPDAVVAALAEACEGRGVTLAEVAGGWAFRTAPDLAQRLTKVVQAPRRLPRAAMEALSIIAYHQPCTRGEIEEIRGAALAQTTLEALLELGLVAPRGRREVPGRPTLWGTTPRFLEQFSLKALGDLPRKEELVTAESGPLLPLGGPGEAQQAQVADEAPADADDAASADPDSAPSGGDAEPPAGDTPSGTER